MNVESTSILDFHGKSVRTQEPKKFAAHGWTQSGEFTLLLMKTLACTEAAVKSEAQIYANLPPRQGGYRTWPFSQRLATIRALKARFRVELNLSGAKAHQLAYRMLKQRWLASLQPFERRAYLEDAKTAKTLPTHKERCAFWAQEAEGGER